MNTLFLYHYFDLLDLYQILSYFVIFQLLSENDESTLVPGLFLCGPAVRQEGQIFCFIYKYRQRFAVVAKAIATVLGLPAEYLETYRMWGMYLDDLSCCGEECAC